MNSLTSIDLIVRDIPGTVAFFRDVVGMKVTQEFDRFAELEGGGVRIMLSPDAMVPMTNAAGVILHFEVADVADAARRAEEGKATILKRPFKTDWGTESVLVQGPEAVVVDFYKNA